MEDLFVYGGMKEPEIQKKVFGRTAQGTPDTLLGYTLSALDIDGNTYPIAIPDEKAEIDGVVIEVSLGELKLIDIFTIELYSRIKIKLKSGKTAWANVISDRFLGVLH